MCASIMVVIESSVTESSLFKCPTKPSFLTIQPLMANSSASQLPTGSGLPSVPGSSLKMTLGDGKSKTTMTFIQNNSVSAAQPALNPMQTNIMHQIQNNKPASNPQPARSFHEQGATSDQLNQQFAKSMPNQQFAKSIHERAATSDQSAKDNFPLDNKPVFGNWMHPPSKYQIFDSDGYYWMEHPIPRVQRFNMSCFPENTTHTPRASLQYAYEMVDSLRSLVLSESYHSYKREYRVRESLQARMTELSQARAELARAREMHTAAETSWRAERAAWEVERAELIRVQDSLYDVNTRLRGRERARRSKAESGRSPSSSSSPSPSTHADTESLTDW